MDSDTDDQPNEHIKLKEGIDLNALREGRGDTFQINFDNIDQDKMYNNNYSNDDYLSSLMGECLGINSDGDDDQDDNSTPFEKLTLKMTNVTEDGKIKKKIKREGTGSTPPANSLVSIYYASYLEYSDEPTDGAFIKKPYQFQLGNACIIGLDIAVRSMKINEKALFLINPDYAFGKMGHPPRIPPNATFLFQVELLRYVDSGIAFDYAYMTNEEKRSFPIAYKTALALIENGKEYFKHNVKLSIREYNRARCLLEECNLSNMEDQEKQQSLLFKIYTNLAICYTKDGKPKKACIMCNNIFAMTKNTSLQIPAKVFFHNGRALFMLGDCKKAREKLLRAQQLEPNNKDIANELSKVSARISEENKKERDFAKAFVNSKEPTQTDANINEETDDSFRIEIRNVCKNLCSNDKQTQFKLPSGLTEKECNIVKVEAERLGLKFKESSKKSKEISFYITKV